MPTHGAHWDAFYGDQFNAEETVSHCIQNGQLVDRHDCIDVVNGTERAETVFCIRNGEGPVFEDMLIVTDTPEQVNQFFSGYPMIRDGIFCQVEIEKILPWEYAIEAWIQAHILSCNVSITYFDTRFYAAGALLKAGQISDIVLSGLAYSLAPCAQSAIDMSSGALFEMERQRRINDGETGEGINRPVQVVLSGMAAFLPREGEQSSDAEFRGVIQAISQFKHRELSIYRLDVTIARHDDVAFDFPIYVTEHVLNGYVPRPGEDVQGVMWMQGYLANHFSS